MPSVHGLIWRRFQSSATECFGDIHPQSAHTTVHYIYKGQYQILGPHNRTLEFETALRNYCAAGRYQLDGLKDSAKQHIESLRSIVPVGATMQLLEMAMLNACEEDCPWLNNQLQAKLRKEFERNQQVFRGGEFQQLFGSFELAVIDAVLDCVTRSRLWKKSIASNTVQQDQSGKQRAESGNLVEGELVRDKENEGQNQGEETQAKEEDRAKIEVAEEPKAEDKPGKDESAEKHLLQAPAPALLEV